MELVCKETRRPFSWFFSPEERKYFQKDKNGEIQGTITGNNLPDPLDILEARKAMVAKLKLPAETRVQADPVTIQLWEHWKDIEYAKYNN